MITSTSNPQIRDARELCKKRKVRDREKLFVVEGLRMLQEIPEGTVRKCFVTEDFLQKHEAEIPSEIGTPEVVSDAVFSSISDTKSPQGVLAVTEQMSFDASQIIGKEKARLMLLDHLQDPGNLGTIFRTAEAAGMDGILMSKDCADIYNPKTVRSTMGAIFRLPFAYLPDTRDMILALRQKGIHVFAADLEGDTLYSEEDYTSSFAFLIGNEGNGLPEDLKNLADERIVIPMQGQAESLNAAVAASVLMFEANRQRLEKE